MIYLFSKSNKLGSKAIRWGLNSDVSHMAILASHEYEINEQSLVIESRLSNGVDVTWLKTFKEHNEIVTAVKPIELMPKYSEKLFRELATQIGGDDYDWRGVSYLTLAALYFVKLLGRDLEGSNLWASSKDQYCSEALLANARWLWDLKVDLNKYPKQMLTPGRAREILLDSGSFEEVYL